MKSELLVALFALAVGATFAAFSGSGTTTRYWDCCKPACAWRENVGKTNPVETCAKDGVSKLNASVMSSCLDGGTAYMCNELQPWAVNDSFAYGFAAASFTGQADTSKCCICVKLTFPSGPLAGKTFVIQNVNTGGDLGFNQFDLQIPGGGVGIFTRGCQTQWNTPEKGWGDQYGGVHSDEECNTLPVELQAGCHFRFGWFKNADNPNVNFEQITCPDVLTKLSGCVNNY